MDGEDSALNDFAEEYLWMRVNSGTKMKNVLSHALKHFPQRHNIILWTGAGQAVSKVISCVELFKKQHPGLHQVAKLRYINSDDEAENIEKTQQIPEINIFLAQDAMDASKFDSTLQTLKRRQGMINVGKMSNTVVEESAKLGDKLRHKRSRNYQASLLDTKKKKK